MTTAIPADHFAHGDARRYRRGCRCRPCTAAASNSSGLSYHYRVTGRGILRPPSRAAEHIWALRYAGLSDPAIRAAANVQPDVLYRILRGAGRINCAVERRLLAVPIPPPMPVGDCHALIDGTGTRRRLQALAAAGWTTVEIAERMGVRRQFIGYLSNLPAAGQVALRTAQLTHQTFLMLWAQQPESHGSPERIAERTRRNAVARGWCVAAAWDDIDDPNDEPQFGARVSRVEAVVEDATELIAEGYSREAIAERLGITWDAVRQAFIRKGTPLPELAA